MNADESAQLRRKAPHARDGGGFRARPERHLPQRHTTHLEEAFGHGRYRQRAHGGGTAALAYERGLVLVASERPHVAIQPAQRVDDVPEPVHTAVALRGAVATGRCVRH